MFFDLTPTNAAVGAAIMAALSGMIRFDSVPWRFRVLVTVLYGAAWFIGCFLVFQILEFFV